MKKVSLLAILATAASIPAAMAQTPVASSANCPKAFQGFHLGGNIGYGVGYGKQKTFLRHTTAAGTFVDSNASKNNLGFNGVDGGIGLGYTHRFCNWALGIAFDANWASTSGKRTNRFVEANIPPVANTTLLSTDKAQLRNSLQLYGRAGYVLANMVMPFVGLGWDNSSWKQSVTVDGFRNSHSKRYNALLWKLGVDFLATKHVVVGFEYTGTSAGKKDLHRKTRAATTTRNALTTGGSFKPQYNKFALTAKLVY
ncbi:MAG: outer membrane beta-barrel protein [Alphaproteobacteria bacterium]|nr:outer membrane beta-barrel protein [Alphaproteobacteria bacterium]